MSTYKKFRSRTGNTPLSYQISETSSLVEECNLKSAPDLVCLKPKTDEVDIVEWCKNNKKYIDERLLEKGALLFRGGDNLNQNEFYNFVNELSSKLMHYTDQHTPRDEVTNKIYTSTNYPKDQVIELHSEMSYSHMWPQKIWFYCHTPSLKGGETPICDNRKVFEQMDKCIVKKFTKHGIKYIRNFGEGIGIPWQSAFNTTDKDEVEKYCKRANISFEWYKNEHLHTEYIGNAVATHPLTKEKVWYNQAHAFHLSSLKPAVRQALETVYTDDEYPNNAVYGNGEKIEEEIIVSIREVYEYNKIIFKWEESDILMLDNMLFSHGRRPFEGERKVLAAMADPYPSKNSE